MVCKHVNKINWFQVLLCITKNSISHLFTQLKDQTVLFQAIQFSISHLFALNSKFQTVLFDLWIGPYQVL